MGGGGLSREGNVHAIRLICIAVQQKLASQGALVVKNRPANAGDIRGVGLIPGLGKSPGGGYGNPLQYSGLENPMDRGAWRATVHEVTRSQTRLKRLNTHMQQKLTQHCKAIFPQLKNKKEE